MQQAQTITSPELLGIADGDGGTWCGTFSQWYGPDRQKQGGGSATAAMMLAYLAETRPEMAPLYPSASRRKEDFVALMEEVWDYTNPGLRILHFMHAVTHGLEDMGADKGCPMPIRELDIPVLRIARPSFSQCEAFLRAGLSANCPVAFLSAGPGLFFRADSWKWRLIYGLEQFPDGRLMCDVLEDGVREQLDFRLWYQTVRGGGALCYIQKEGAL